jgi:hypothetical protein
LLQLLVLPAFARECQHGRATPIVGPRPAEPAFCRFPARIFELPAQTGPGGCFFSNHRRTECVPTPMRAAALRYAVVANALLLALPAGWCGATWLACEPAQEAAHAGCCPESTPDHASSPGRPASGSTDATCCCHREAVPPGKSVQIERQGGAGLFAVPVSAAADVSRPATCASWMPAEIAAGPPLRILQCVWRC